MLPPRSLQLAILVCPLSAPAWAQTTVPGGLIDTDTTWTAAGSPYLIDAHLLVGPAVTLTIEAGAEVRFMGDYRILISGRLLADGTASAPIMFVPDVPGNGWDSLWFTQFATDGSVLRRCTFEEGHVNTEFFFPLIDHCTFHNQFGEHIRTGVPFWVEGEATLTNSVFEGGARIQI